MTIESLFVYLYPLLGISCFIGYLPQIKAFVTAQKAPTCFAIGTWIFWMAETSISFGYGYFHLKDAVFCALSALDFFLMGGIVALAVYTRYFRFPKRETARDKIILREATV